MNPRSINLLFLAIVSGVPLMQAALELARHQRPQALEVVGPLDGVRLRRFEDDLRRASFIHETLSPWYQLGLLELLGRGNEKTFVGAEGWLHYSADLDYLTGQAILRSPAALDCISDVRDQLRERGVELLLVPVPPKTCAVASTLSRWCAARGWVDNVDADAFYAALRARDVPHLRVDELLRAEPAPAYMPRDTHWAPAAMERVARAAAAYVRDQVGLEERAIRAFPAQPQSAPGDLVGMLRLPRGARPFPDVTVPVRPVPRRWGEFALESEVLLLGDSFTRVFSDPELGFGEGSGLGEVLAQELGLPVDRIAISGGGARAVREALARRSGRAAEVGGLAGKRVVVWQFSMRDLARDSTLWEPIALAPARSGPSRGEEVGSMELRILARLREASVVREHFEYAFALGIHEYEVLESEGALEAGARVWVAIPIVRDWQPTSESNLAPGVVQRLVLEPVERHYDLEQTSWVDDTDAPVRARLWFPTMLEPAD